MSFTTYNELKTRLAEILEDDGSETAAYIPTAIFLAEERVAKDLDLQTFQETVITSAFTNTSIPGGGIETIVSTGIADATFLYFDHVFNCGQKLDMVDYSFTKEIDIYESSAGTSASYYSFKNDPNTLYFAPPVSVVQCEIVYTRRPEKLAAGVQTNDILKKAPELLLYASMIEMSLFQKNWETKGFWDEMYKNSLESNLNTTRRERHDVSQKHRNPANTQSTLGN